MKLTVTDQEFRNKVKELETIINNIDANDIRIETMYLVEHYDERYSKAMYFSSDFARACHNETSKNSSSLVVFHIREKMNLFLAECLIKDFIMSQYFFYASAEAYSTTETMNFFTNDIDELKNAANAINKVYCEKFFEDEYNDFDYLELFDEIEYKEIV